MSIEKLRLKPRKELLKLTKKEIFDNLENDAVIIDNIIKEKDDIINTKYKLISELEKKIDELDFTKKEMIKIDETKNKDLSIMQQALNDVEEKNRALNSQIIDLRKAMKTMSQFL